MFRDIIIFLAGLEFWHTFTHIFFAFFVALPLDTKLIKMTRTKNRWGVIINGFITIALIWWATQVAR